mmetsp:Transcript_18025/g.42128  ORF Transcript_18025/g.42128 Transcript_18025/m.42128 type:complete len:299 (+) Transcript_18025:146-1042(+)
MLQKPSGAADMADEEQPLLGGASGVDLQPRDWQGPCCLHFLERRIAFSQLDVEAHRRLTALADVKFDSSSSMHEGAVKKLWESLLDGHYQQKSPRWQDLGFQGDDPRTDFRGGGYLGLQCLCHLGAQHAEETKKMISDARNAGYEYFFAAAAINVCALLVTHLRLTAVPLAGSVRTRPACNLALKAVLQDMSSADELSYFLNLFTAAVRRTHFEWMQYCLRNQGANIMSFPLALQATNDAVEVALLTCRDPCEQLGASRPMSAASGLLSWIYGASSGMLVALLSGFRCILCQSGPRGR